MTRQETQDHRVKNPGFQDKRPRMIRTKVGMKIIKSAPASPTGLQGSTAIIEKDPGPSFAINQGPFMNSLISRKREHLSERQRVVRTLEISEFMGPIAKLGPGSTSTTQQPQPALNLI